MVPTLRFAASLALAAVLVGFSGRFAPLLTAGAALAALSLVLLLADWISLTRRVNLEVARSCEDKLSLGAANQVRIRLRNYSYTSLRGMLRDEHPECIDADRNMFPIELAPRSESDLVYHLTPHRRGDYEFGDIYVRLFGPFGLALRQIRYPAKLQVKVYPNLLDIRKYELALRRERPVQPGLRVIRAYGRGTEFESLRDYLPDDEQRAVDWKATARRGKLTVRQYQHERSQNVVLVLDCGRLMGTRIDGLTKLDHSVNAGMMLAHVAAVKGDKVGMIAFADEIAHYSPPRAGRGQTLNLLSLAYNLQDAAGDSNYNRALTYLSRRWTRRSLLVLFSDLVDGESSWPLISQVAALAKKHLCLCIALTDPLLVEAAYGEPKTPDDAYRAAAARQSLQARKLAAAALARAGAIVVDTAPHQLTPALVDAYLEIKSRARL